MDLNEYVETEDALFHYTKTSVALEKILYTQKFKLSLLKDTNDPREYKYMLLNTIGWSLPPEAEELSREAHPIIDRILKYECRVMCFCSNKKPTVILENGSHIDDEHAYSNGWDKSRMWAQYGENHFGICLVISKEKLEEELKTHQDKITRFKTGYIKYTQKRGIAPRAITLDGNRLVNEGLENYSKNHILENSEELFFRKHADYRDETEYRVLVFDPENNLEYIDISSSIKGIIVGDRTPKVYFPLVDQLCEKLHIESRQAHWVKGTPYLLLCKSQ